ncbi:MAG: TonB-dependent receptor, partial [Verrucomicrobia bacterium]|nr:TonB-dependent receptor [Verrucomicrobiota bacterium]
IAGGTPFSFGPDFVIGATGRGSLGQSEGFNTQHNIMSLGVLSYRFDNGDWHVDALVTGSTARQWTTREGEGYFGGFSTAVKVPVRLSYLDINEMGPGTVEAYTNTNQRFDIYDINNYNVTAVSGGRLDRRETMKAGNLNVKRRLGFLPFPAALQVGWAGREQTRDSQTYTRNYTYNGINGDFSAKTFEAVVYRNIHEEQMTGIERNPPPGKGAPYASPHLAYRAYLGNPNLFTTTAAQAVTMEQGRRANSLYIEEGVDALYAQGEMRLFKNRLNILGGVRYERTTNFGKGLLNNPNAVWMRNPDGSFARNAAGARIRRTEAGAAGSLDELNLTQTERGYTASRSFDGYYPSLHFTYNISDNLVARAAYAATYGRPNYANIVPNTVINETDFGGGVPDPNVVKGTLTVRNTGLRPWTADNYDLSLEYYTNSGGLFGAGVFDKEIKDFFGTLSKVATAADVAELGLEPSFVGWQVNTQINTGDAQVSGVEVSANQSLHILGRWGKPFKVFANVTKIKVKGAAEGDFSGFLPQVINYGVTFSKSGLIVMAKWNQRSDVAQGLQAYLGPDARAHIKGRTILDMNISYQIWKGTSLFFNARNLTNERVDYLRYGSQTPAYASVFQARSYGGATFDAGVKGSF